ncbi:MAG: hypothetical protein IPP72_15635 [Chitinophagaceae bacterium]|nr:hypothetical protein [Chitinophagaceae bacterium]
MKQLIFFICNAVAVVAPGSATAQFKYEYVDLKIMRNTEMPLRYLSFKIFL